MARHDYRYFEALSFLQRYNNYDLLDVYLYIIQLFVTIEQCGFTLTVQTDVQITYRLEEISITFRYTHSTDRVTMLSKERTTLKSMVVVTEKSKTINRAEIMGILVQNL